MPKIYKYTDEIAHEICEIVSNTSLGLKPLCKKYPHWPQATTIRKWIRQNPSFASMYARAKLDQADMLAEEILEISDDATNDWMINEKGVTVTDHEHINRSRLRVDSRKWLSAKLAPRIYGEKKDDKISNDDAINQFRVTDE